MRTLTLFTCLMLGACSDDKSPNNAGGSGGGGNAGASGAGGADAAGTGGSAPGSGGSTAGSGGTGAAGASGTSGTSGTDGGSSPSHGNVLAISNRGGCIINRDEDLNCWGFLDDSAPAPGTADFAAVSVFYDGEYVCALDVAGDGRCWSGISTYDVTQSAPLQQIAVGTTYACAIQLTDQSIACWVTAGTSMPSILQPPTGAFTRIAAGNFNVCGVRSTGSVTCWGESLLGALDAPMGSFERIASGEFYSCAGGSAGNACWGGSTPATPANALLRALSVAETYGCGVRDNDGSIVCWGAAPSSPPQGAFREISVSTRHACAVKNDGTLACWGELSASQTPPAGLVVK